MSTNPGHAPHAHRGGSSLPTAVASRSERVVLITRKGCHLCERAEQVIEQVCGQVTHTSIDVDEDVTLSERYTDHVPVVFVDGELGAYWTLNADQLTGLLTDPAAPRPAPL